MCVLFVLCVYDYYVRMYVCIIVCYLCILLSNVLWCGLVKAVGRDPDECRGQVVGQQQVARQKGKADRQQVMPNMFPLITY